MDREKRKLDISTAISRELHRQGVPEAATIDLHALAEAVDRALEEPEPVDVDELSREPDDLNAANDI